MYVKEAIMRMSFPQRRVEKNALWIEDCGVI